MGNVVRFATHKHRNTIAALRDMLQHAEKGHILGVAFALKTICGHTTGFTGDYADDPIQAMGSLTRLLYKANQLASAVADEPDTESMPL